MLFDLVGYSVLVVCAWTVYRRCCCLVLFGVTLCLILCVGCCVLGWFDVLLLYLSFCCVGGMGLFVLVSALCLLCGW